MDFVMENPVLSFSILVVIAAVISIVIGVALSKKRQKEVEELERMFPDDHLSHEDMKISVEKVRRATREREKRKRKQQQIASELPVEALPDEDKEIIDLSELEERFPKKEAEATVQEKKVSGSRLSRSSRLAGQPASDEASSQADGRSKLSERLEQVEASEQTFAVRRTTKKAPKELKKEETIPSGGGQEEQLNAATSRRLYKRSLLKGNASFGDTLTKASLINPQMFSGEEKSQATEAAATEETAPDASDREGSSLLSRTKRRGKRS
jgi:hypothetical protein